MCLAELVCVYQNLAKKKVGRKVDHTMGLALPFFKTSKFDCIQLSKPLETTVSDDLTDPSLTDRSLHFQRDLGFGSSTYIQALLVVVFFKLFFLRTFRTIALANCGHLSETMDCASFLNFRVADPMHT